MPIDWLEDFLQEITERRSPDEHAMSSTVYCAKRERFAYFGVASMSDPNAANQIRRFWDAFPDTLTRF